MGEALNRTFPGAGKRLSAAALLIGLVSAAFCLRGQVRCGKERILPEGNAFGAEKEAAEAGSLGEGASGRNGKEAEGARWLRTGAGWKYLDASGRAAAGEWILDGGAYYYLNAAGIMEYDCFQRIGGRRYHFAESGALDTGRFTVGGIEYYADENGVPAEEGWIPAEGGRWFYCDSLGRILKNTMTPDAYFVGEDGFLAAAPGTRFESFSYVNGGTHRLYLNLGAADVIWNNLKQRGWNAAAIAGVLGNFQQESGLDPALVERGSCAGYGLGQWSFERREALERYARADGRSPSDIGLQLDFLCQEPGERSFVDAYAKKEWSSPAAAAVEWGLRWERYPVSDGSMSRVRIPYAEAYYAHYVHGVKYLVSHTHFSGQRDEAAPASASDAERRTDAAAEGEAAPEGAEEKEEREALTEGSFSDGHCRSEGKTRVIKVKRITDLGEEERSGPGEALSEQ